MKKRLLIIAGVLIALVVSLFFIFPARQKVEGTYVVGASLQATLRLLQDQPGWARWLPQQHNRQGERSLRQNFVLAGNPEDRIVLLWFDNKDTLQVLLTATPMGTDSSLLVYQAELQTGLNLVKRIEIFARGQRLSNDIKTLLTSFGLFAADPRQVYGFEPRFTMVTDTLLITTRSAFAEKPGTAELYAQIDKLQQYAEKEQAHVTGDPMYQVVQRGGNYEMQVALPVNKMLRDNGPYVAKRMVDGHLLTVEVQAGPLRLQNLYHNFELYRSDYQLVSPAIPYLQPLTDRRKEPDTLKWVTRMCYPIF